MGIFAAEIFFVFVMRDCCFFCAFAFEEPFLHRDTKIPRIGVGVIFFCIHVIPKNRFFKLKIPPVPKQCYWHKERTPEGELDAKRKACKVLHFISAIWPND